LNPNQLEWLKDNPDQSEAATEELLRFDSPVAVNARTALEDIEIDGVTVKKGQSVILLQGSGNYDHDFTSNPAELELKKGDKGHLSFGRGIHYCLGAPLARLEGQIGFGRFLSEWSNIELIEQPIYKDHIVLRGLRSLRIRVSK
jgi:cytochrome P450